MEYAGIMLGFCKSKVTSDIKKYKESAYMTCLSNPISQPSLDISPILIPSPPHQQLGL
jgi:hypothetical protein